MNAACLLLAATLSIPHGRVVIETIHSAALEHNRLGDPADQKIGIYLPPSYDKDMTTRYPVVYLLHGFGGSGVRWFEKPEPGSPAGAPLLKDTLDAAMASGSVSPMIVVTPNGENRLGGSFYENEWDAFVAHDVVGYVDAHYRTIAKREDRGIAGNSMGGFGALVVGGRHSDVFGAIYAMSPCCTAMVEDLSEKNPAWKTLLRAQDQMRAPTAEEMKDFHVVALWALASALTPDQDRTGFYADLPYRMSGDKVVRDDAVFTRWQASLPMAVLATHADQLRSATPIAIEYGLQDEFPHIPEGARQTSSVLALGSIPYTLDAFTGKHMNLLHERLRTVVFPWFSRMFAAHP